MLVLEKYLLTFAISIILMAYPLYCTVERISLLESDRFGFQYCFVTYSLYNVRKITLPVQAFFFSSLNKKMEMMVSGRIFTFFLNVANNKNIMNKVISAQQTTCTTIILVS